MAERDLSRWRGVDADPAQGPSDYERACAVVDYVGVIDVGDASALILGDEPFPTAWHSTDDGGILIRWVYSDSEASIDAFLSNTNCKICWTETGLSVPVPGQCVLFDAAEPGVDIRGECLVLTLSAGDYAVRSAVVDPSDEVRLVLHELSLVKRE
ncbi:hypothetical protein ENSA7_78980 [Enhygromyxa salina]|uniref:Uncharacterized protein n=2 Tax=Enhygromyxa salina TaxID=215803 RepID=A0A2S9XLZ0_9BACT|nr:hypothetical protein ENSA7_78980 [Enhygromyxa salina]